ncbi:MAG TPA: class I SAM-dependent methyltransferase [Patescibacteria group bacterium]
MLNFLKNYFRKLFTSWTKEEQERFASLLERREGCSFVDLGSGDGRLTMRFATAAGAKRIYGVDSISLKKKIKSKKIIFVPGNLNKKLPFSSNSQDVVVSHFSLEHLYNTGFFIQETKRILKKGGYTVVATDNLSNWPNVISLIMGWQPSVSAYGVANKVLGNPFALEGDFKVEKSDELGELSHNKVLAYQMLVDAYKEFGFVVEKIAGVGYFPFYGIISRLFCFLDRKHAHWLIIKAIKK